ncbi:MAG: IMP cyclohydrolase [Deltaproteobacteria bacterium]|nr:IMP cyclohydrolase [Deltaproteobacteria bacterium]
MINIKEMYHRIVRDNFPRRIKIDFEFENKVQTLVYEKVNWVVEGELRGLRYGENPDQEAAFYRLVNGNLVIADIEYVGPELSLLPEAELIQFGKHPGKINLTDVDNALNILKFLSDKPSAAIMKHNNPSGVASADNIYDAFLRAYFSDRIAAFGGVLVVNREIDKIAAELISDKYLEVVAAPEFGDGAIDILTKRKNLRIMRIRNMDNLKKYIVTPFIDFKSLMDGSLIIQRSQIISIRGRDDLKIAEAEFGGKKYRINREPTEREYRDMLFGWFVESGVTSNSVIYVKDECTVGIGTGEQDRVGVAEIARYKAYTKLADKICFERYGISLYDLKDESKKRAIEEEVREKKGGLIGAVMVSDGFFPFRDGVDVGIKEGITAVIQPGGSVNDYQVIEACNEAGVTMVFTGQRLFKH